MRERGAFNFLAILLGAAVLYYAITSAEDQNLAGNDAVDDETVVRINGRPFEPNYVDQGADGRLIVVIEEEDLYEGENTVELQWGEKPPSTMTADLSGNSEPH